MPPQLTKLLARFDTAFLATASADGQPYVQHRGGPRGFVRVVDENTIGFADLAGNRQYLTVGNLGENDKVCLFLIDYARRLRVKIWGTATIIPASDSRIAQLAVPGTEIERGILIRVERWDVNCPQHIPQKIDAADVARVLAERDERIAELTARVAELTVEVERSRAIHRAHSLT